MGHAGNLAEGVRSPVAHRGEVGLRQVYLLGLMSRSTRLDALRGQRSAMSSRGSPSCTSTAARSIAATIAAGAGRRSRASSSARPLGAEHPSRGAAPRSRRRCRAAARSPGAERRARRREARVVGPRPAACPGSPTASTSPSARSRSGGGCPPRRAGRAAPAARRSSTARARRCRSSASRSLAQQRVVERRERRARAVAREGPRCAACSGRAR